MAGRDPFVVPCLSEEPYSKLYSKRFPKIRVSRGIFQSLWFDPRSTEKSRSQQMMKQLYILYPSSLVLLFSGSLGLYGFDGHISKFVTLLNMQHHRSNLTYYYSGAM